MTTRRHADPRAALVSAVGMVAKKSAPPYPEIGTWTTADGVTLDSGVTDSDPVLLGRVSDFTDGCRVLGWYISNGHALAIHVIDENGGTG